MKVWVVIGSDGSYDVFPVGVYLTKERATRRARTENSQQSYYNYTVSSVTFYNKTVVKEL